VKPFLFLATRSDDEPADAEYEAFLKRTGLDESTLRRLRLESESLPQIDLDDWSGILVGGSPFNASTPAEKKSATQKRVEAELSGLLDRVVGEGNWRPERIVIIRFDDDFRAASRRFQITEVLTGIMSVGQQSSQPIRQLRLPFDGIEVTAIEVKRRTLSVADHEEGYTLFRGFVGIEIQHRMRVRGDGGND